MSSPYALYQCTQTYGDALLQFQISDLLSERFDHLHTGGITVRHAFCPIQAVYRVSDNVLSPFSDDLALTLKDMRSWLVRNTTLARLATLYGLQKDLRVSKTNKSAESVMQSFDMAANIFEAVSWAVRKEHGVEVAAQWLHALFGPLADLVYQDLGGRHQFKAIGPKT